MIEAIVDAEIPVMGHIGLTPQSMHVMGGFKVQGRATEAAMALRRRRQGAAARRLLRGRHRGCARRGRRVDHRGGRHPHHRHRRRAALRRPGAGLPRPPGHRGSLHAQVRAPLRRCQGRTRSTRWPPTPTTCVADASPPTTRATTSAASRPRSLALYGIDRPCRRRRPARQLVTPVPHAPDEELSPPDPLRSRSRSDNAPCSRSPCGGPAARRVQREVSAQRANASL